MREELDKKLVEKYPKIFKNRFGDMRETAMCWGFECGDGWYWLIDQLCSSAQSYLNANGEGISLVADQVKEKFGTLRFYAHFEGDLTEQMKDRNIERKRVTDLVDGMVWMAEDMSASICEKCGSTENVAQNKEGWISTRCGKCRD